MASLWSRARDTVPGLLKQHLRTPSGAVGLVVLIFLMLSGVELYLNWTQTLMFVAGLLRHPWILWLSLTAFCVAAFFYSAHDAKRHTEASTAALLRPIREKLDLTTGILVDYEVLTALAQGRMECAKAFKYCKDSVTTFDADASTSQLQLSEFRRRVGEIIITVEGFAGLLRELSDGEFHLAVPWTHIGEVSIEPTPEEHLPANELKSWRQVRYFYEAADQSFGSFELTWRQRLKEKREQVRALNGT